MTWIEDDRFDLGCPFGPQALPYGVIDTGDGPVPAVRVGDHALSLRSVAGFLGPRLTPVLVADSLDPLLAATPSVWTELRARLSELVTAASRPPGAQVFALDRCRTRLPFTVGDYVDFYSSRAHVENVSRIFRPDSPTVPANWTYLPVGYHGRSGTVVVSGTPIRRPCGQRWSADRRHVEFGPTARLDIEAEVGFVCGGQVASRVRTDEVTEHVFGVVLVNDWSARDIQAFESQPLGPFLGKSFATSISAWITPLEALDAARITPPPPPHPLARYLVETRPWGLDLDLAITWNDTLVARPPFAVMSWTCAQQLAHLTVNGATVRPGDLFASGTVSGPSPEQRGSFLELTWDGSQPLRLRDATTRTYVEDGDTVMVTGTARGSDGSRVGLAEVIGTVVPAEETPSLPGRE